MTQKTASLLANSMLGRGLVPDTAPRLDGLRVLPALSQWWRNPQGSAALLVLGDSTGWSPGTVNGSPIPNTANGGYIRWVDSLAQKCAAAGVDVNVRLWVNDFTNGNNKYQAVRVLHTGTDGDRYAYLPGGNNLVLWWPKTNGNRLTGARHFFAAKVKPAAWSPGAAQTILSDWGVAGQQSWSFGLNTTGALWFSYSTTGSDNVNKFSTVAPSGVVDNSTILWLGVDVQWDNGAGGATFTFYTSTDGDAWTQLGTPQTNATVLTPFQTTAPYQIGCRTIGGSTSANFAGNVYEVRFRSGGMYGPTFLPTQVDQYDQHPGTPNVSTPFYPFFGSPTLDIINASWPGQGLVQFDDATNLPLLVPHFPYLGVIYNTAHNDQTYNTQKTLADKWDRMVARVAHRAPDAEMAVLTQNPTLRTDGPTSPVNNPNGVRYQHTARVARLAAYARSRGMGVIDTYQAFEDWATYGTGAGLSDLLDNSGGTQIIHPEGAGVTRQTQKVYDEVFGA